MPTRTEPDNPSLALCGICRFRGDYKTLERNVKGSFDLFPTCEQYALERTCPGFTPGNLKRRKPTLQDVAKMMIENAQYGRF